MSLLPRSAPSESASPGPYLLLILLMAGFAIFFGALAVQQHAAYQTNGLDIGNVDQALWNTAQGRFMHFTLMAPVESRLALHVEPLLLLFVPLYWLGWGSPEFLLITQALVVALGAWPLYQLSIINYQLSRKCHRSCATATGNGKKWGDTPQAPRPAALFSEENEKDRGDTPQAPRPAALFYLLLLFPLAYLLLPALESAVLFDFHAVTLAATFLLFAFWALETRRNGLFFLFAVLAMACKEDMPLVVLMLGVYAGLAQRRWRLAALTTALSLGWFIVAVLVIQPLFAPAGNIQLDRYAWLGDSLPAIAWTVATRPDLVLAHLWQQADLLGYLTMLFFPTAFLALFSPLTLLPMLPTLAVNLLSDNPFTWRLEDFHYGAPLAPFLFISAIYGIRNIHNWLARRVAASNRQGAGRSVAHVVPTRILLLLIFTLVYHVYRGYTPLARSFIWPEVTGHHRQLTAILDTIPPDAPLFAQSNLAPHLSQRRTLYADFGYFTDPDFPASKPVQDIVLDITSFENIGGLHQFLQQTLLASGNYRLAAARDGILHLQPGAAPEPIALPPEFYPFARPGPPLDYPLQADFGDLLTLHAFSLHFNRQEAVQVTVDLEARQPLANVQPVLYLLDAEGRPLGATTDLQPGLVWYPVERWLPGQPVRLRFNTLPWHTRDMDRYRLALGVVRGSDVWDVSQRVTPLVERDVSFAVRLPADGTLLELAPIEQTWQMPDGAPRPRDFSRPNSPRPLRAHFGQQISLFGHGAPAIEPVGPGEPPQLSIRLYWQATAPPEALVRFVQLVGPDGQLYGQQDSAPDRNQYPTNLWQPGEVVVETVTFPVALRRPPAGHALHLGFYRPDTGQRLRLPSGADHAEIRLR